MVFSFSVLMGSYAASFHAYLYIQRTTQRSMSFPHHLCEIWLTPWFRCLVACIKCLSRHACPDCTMDRCNFWKMGMKTDVVDRVKVARKDSSILHDAIAMVRKWIFEEGTAPNGKNVKATKLGSFSMTPTRVRLLSCNFRCG